MLPRHQMSRGRGTAATLPIPQISPLPAGHERLEPSLRSVMHFIPFSFSALPSRFTGSPRHSRFTIRKRGGPLTSHSA